MAAERFGAVESVLTDLGASVKAMGERIQNVESGMQQTQADVISYQATIAGEKANLTKSLNVEFDKMQKALIDIVNDARNEFTTLRGSLTTLTSATGQTFQQVADKVKVLEDSIAAQKTGTNAQEFRGYLPRKAMMPKTFGKDGSDWRRFKDDAADFLDSGKPGMGRLLKDIEKAEHLDAAWEAQATNDYGHDLLKSENRADVYRFLKAITEAEARMVVQSTSGEDGLLAWKALHTRFSQSLAAEQGKAQADLAMMVNKPARNPGETKTLVTNLDRAIRHSEDVSGQETPDSFAKAILIGILDPTTKAHTTPFHGVSTAYAVLRRHVLEFANSNDNGTSTKGKGNNDAMEIGHLNPYLDNYDQGNQDQGVYDQGNYDQNNNTEPSYLDAVRTGILCYKCGGHGHTADVCPSAPTKGQGKGAAPGPKGKGKGDMGKGGPKGAKGKGKSKGGPKNGSCWTCGGPHFHWDCPQANSGKGKGGQKGFNSMEQSWPTASQAQSFVHLAALNAVSPVKVHNRFAALDFDDGDTNCSSGPRSATLADFIRRPQQQQSQKTQQPVKQQRQMQTPVSANRYGRPHSGGAGTPPHPSGAHTGSLNPLMTIEPDYIAPVGALPEWEEIELMVDSGASETVVPDGLVKSVETRPSDASRRGVQYEVANGQRIPNLGEKHLQGLTDNEGYRRSITAQVCDVNKPLMSVKRLIETGHSVVFDEPGAYIEHKASGERIWLKENNGMYMLKLWMPTSGF